MSTSGRGTGQASAPTMARLPTGASDPGMDLPEPDANDENDFINDFSLDKFLAEVGTGDEKLDPPGKDDRAWPPLPDGVQRVSGDYFRRPDFTIGQGGRGRMRADGDEADVRPYDELLDDAMDRLGLVQKRGVIKQCVRGLATFVVSATGVGACYTCSRTERLPPGEIAFYLDGDRQPHYVSTGWSLEINPLHNSFERFRSDQDTISYAGQVHIVRVLPGRVVKALQNGAPVLLTAGDNNSVGVHVIWDVQFKVDRTYDVDSMHIDASPFHILTVPPQKVVGIEIDRKPYVLFEGRHELESSTLRVMPGDYSLRESFRFSMITYLITYPGDLGAIKVASTACFVDRPVALWVYSHHAEILAPPVPLETEKVIFANLTRVLVADYKLGIMKAANGTLLVLKPGVTVLSSPAVFLDSISLEAHNASRAIIATTADPLDVKLTVVVSYRIEQPITFWKSGPPERSHGEVVDMAVSTVSESLRGLRFETAFMSDLDSGRERHKEAKEAADAEAAEGADVAIGTASVQQQWHDTAQPLIQRLSRFLITNYGVRLDVETYGFSGLDLVDSTIQEQLAKSVFARSEARAERVRLDLAHETAEARKAMAKIEAELESYKLRLAAESRREVDMIDVRSREAVRNAEIDAQFARKEKERQIEIDDVKAGADAALYAEKLKADAEAYAVRARAEALADLYAKVPQELELELARVHSSTVAGMQPHVFVGGGGGAGGADSTMQMAVAQLVGSAVGGKIARQQGE